MIGLDTNVSVHYIVRDDPVQTDAVTRLIESRCMAENWGFASLIASVETVWVLSRGYRYEKPILVKILRMILAALEFMVGEIRYLRGLFGSAGASLCRGRGLGGRRATTE